ncbi:MAG: hypothetical protein FWE94_04260 [Coriobacteriia bacterium]|nr:hypothetical protein [Coriobacteriia bacterium]
MDPVLKEIYSTVLGAAPYVLGAYGLLWLGLMVYIAMGVRRTSALEKQIAVLEESLSSEV